MTMKTTSSPSSSTPLNATVNEYQSSPARRSSTAAAALRALRLETLRLVVERLVATRAQDGLAEPLQSEREQQRADDEAKRPDRDRAKRRPERRDEHREHDRGGADTDQSRAPAAHNADSEHDRQRLHHLHRTRQKGPGNDQNRGRAHNDRLAQIVASRIRALLDRVRDPRREATLLAQRFAGVRPDEPRHPTL